MCLPFAIPPQPIMPTFTILSIIFRPPLEYSGKTLDFIIDKAVGLCYNKVAAKYQKFVIGDQYGEKQHPH
jgi:hypothetical protein